MPSNALTADQRATFQALEAVIAEGVAKFVAVGSALMQIREDRLYCESHGTFANYLTDRWQMTARMARYLIEANQINADIGGEGTSEFQVRPLARVPSERRRDVWERAREGAGDAPVTAAHVTAAVEESLSEVAADTNSVPEDEDNANSGVVDSDLRLVPAVIADVFDQTLFTDALNVLRQLTGVVNQIEGGPWGDMLIGTTEGVTLRNRIQEVRDTIKWAAPHAVCPYCEGSAEFCEPCHGKGWFNHQQWSNTPADIRQRS